MIIYKGIYLVSKEEYLLIEGKEPIHHTEILDGIHFLRRNDYLVKMMEVAGINALGNFDYAIPQDWFNLHHKEWEKDWTQKPVWFYYKDRTKGSTLFGEPMTIGHIIYEFSKKVKNEAITMWIAAQEQA